MKQLEPLLDIADLEVVCCGVASSGIWREAPISGSDILKNATPSQPESSRAAMEAYEQMCDDTTSTISRAATWGTCCGSSPSNPECVDNAPSDSSITSTGEADITSGLESTGSKGKETHGEADPMEGRGIYIALFYPF